MNDSLQIKLSTGAAQQLAADNSKFKTLLTKDLRKSYRLP